jgi:short-subunit dehydrogenase
MLRKISDSVVVITGASSGIGRATALQIAKKKGTLVLAARQEEALQDAAEECGRLGARVLAIETDVTDEGQVQNLAQRAVETFGRIDAWVNDAAVTMLARFEQSPSDSFRRVIETNFFGYVHGARAVLPQFRAQGYGVLVNVASILGKAGAPYSSAYVASKFAITGFSESLRMELLDARQIHVCTILPATIDTPLFQKAANYTGRVVQPPPPVYPPEEVAAAIVRCLTHPKREVPVGNAGRMNSMRTMAPALAERIIARKIDRQHLGDKSAPPSDGNLFQPLAEFHSVHGGWLNGHGKKPKGFLAAALLLAGAGAASYFSYRRRQQPVLRRLSERLLPNSLVP